MPSWGQILAEVNNATLSGIPNALDVVRQKYVKSLSELTGRDTIIYASKWTSGETLPNLTSIVDEDLQGFMEAIYGLKNNNLDLILHTGGGSAEAADAIVSYLRQKFDNIRVIVPQAAMSAGTMIACSGDNIVMGKHSFLGPIDPQIFSQNGFIPAQSIIQQFRTAQKEIKEDPTNLSSWIPILNHYGPALIVQCENQIEFSKRLVQDWLNQYMFKGEDGRKATEISEYLCDHLKFLTHSKHINIIKAKELGLKIIDLENDQKLQEAVLSVYHSVMINFNAAAVKIICNQNGNAFLKQQIIQVPAGMQPAQLGQQR